MVNSRNLVSIRLLRDIGVNYAREYISGFGFDTSELPANLSMALGSADLPPMAMVRGYAVFANGGFLVEPFFIRSISDGDGNVVYRANPTIICEDCESEQSNMLPPVLQDREKPEFRPLAFEEESGGEDEGSPQRQDTTPVLPPRYAPRVISEQNAYLVRSLMMDVIRRGTGVKAMQLGRSDLAGKTGTTNEQRDAWFSGYNNYLATTVWVGFDSHAPLGSLEVGGRAALPIWIGFMRVALEGVPDELPQMPDGLAQARIDPVSGLLARPDNPDAIMELFEAGNLPRMEDSSPGENPDEPEEVDPYDIY